MQLSVYAPRPRQFSAAALFGNAASLTALAPDRRAIKALFELLDGAALLLSAPALRVLEASAGSVAIFGFGQRELAKMDLLDLFSPAVDEATTERLRRFAAGEKSTLSLDVTARPKREGVLRLELTLRRLDLESPLIFVVARPWDLPAESGRTPIECDPLTGLPARHIWLERLESALTSVNPAATTSAVLFVDLDCFKRINDRFGHQAGDEVLRVVAERMVAAVRPVDTVSRFGGDEFVVLLDAIGSAGKAAQIARRIRKAVQTPIPWRDRSLVVSASIGSRIAVPGRASAEQTIAAADRAMYRAKARTGRNRRAGRAWNGRV